MVENIDSIESEQRAYMSYHEDGLLDLLLGLAILLGGLNMLLDWEISLGALWVVVWLPLWLAAKRWITARRMPVVAVSEEQYAGMMRAAVFVVVALILAVFAGMVVLWGQSTGNMPAWFFEGLREYLIVVLGLFGVLVIAVAGWLSGLNRLYAYAAMTAVAFVGGYLLKAPMALAVTMTGAVITLWGGVMLARFVRKYPKEIA